MLIRKIYIIANNVVNKFKMDSKQNYKQIDLFTDYNELEINKKKEERESKMQKAILDIKNRYGKNAIIKGMDLQSAGTTIERNSQIGGHKA